LRSAQGMADKCWKWFKTKGMLSCCTRAEAHTVRTCGVVRIRAKLSVFLVGIPLVLPLARTLQYVAKWLCIYIYISIYIYI
jgi:hypothetical protein